MFSGASLKAKTDGRKDYFRTRLIGIQNTRGQVAALNWEKPGGCNYYNEPQGWNDSQGELTDLKRVIYMVSWTGDPGDITDESQHRYYLVCIIITNQGWMIRQLSALAIIIIKSHDILFESRFELVFRAGPHWLKRRLDQQEEGLCSTMTVITVIILPSPSLKGCGHLLNKVHSWERGAVVCIIMPPHPPQNVQSLEL